MAEPSVLLEISPVSANNIVCFNTVFAVVQNGAPRTGGSSVNPYNPSVSESATDSRYVSFGLTWHLGLTEMESQQSHGKKEPRKKGK